MALQGTIDTFPLTDVLGLLASSKKSGRLVLDGDRGHVELWIEDGDVIGGDMVGGDAATAASLLFELLRFTDADFVFDVAVGGDTPPHDVDRTSIGDGLRDAEALVEEWEGIATVVPSLAHRIVLVEELPEDTVRIDAATWRLVRAASVDPVVAVVGDALGLDEFGACAAAASLVESGLATIAEPVTIQPPSPFAAVTPESATEPAPTESVRSGAALGSAFPEVRAVDPGLDPVLDRTEPAAEPEPAEVALADAASDAAPSDDEVVAAAPREFPDHFPIDDLLGGGDEPDDAWSSPEMERLQAERSAATPGLDRVSFDGLPPLDAFSEADGTPIATGPEAWDDLLPEPAPDATAEGAGDDSTDEVLRQMSKLSPQAAEAIAAALNSVPAAAAPAPAREASNDDRGPDGDGDGPVTFSGLF